MYRRALQSLFVAATALLLTTTACDAGGDAKGDAAKKGPDKAADDGKAEGEPAADDGKAEGEPAAAAEAGAEVAADAGAAAGGETGGGETGDVTGETGEAAAADDGGDKPDADGGDKPQKKPAGDGDKAAAGPKIDGKPIFEKKCKSCHGIDGKGDTTIGKKVDIPSLAKTKLSKGKIVTLITNGVPDTKMKAFKGKLSKEEIDAVAAYVKKL